ncbi:hypothetical protein HPP92_023642 [Vanilla planifolia]|uniref:50S ribosomal protein L21, chloroplastic n=1 Tax=Vanilla planifolia TaxID=51239 RepID=A0A835PM54_VANPL|nr:hypothetical protein HPP92_023642 [Vanilla planifolia]
MASILGGAAASFVARVSIPTAALFPEPRPRTFDSSATNRSSVLSCSPFLSLGPLLYPSALRSPKWNPSATAMEDALASEPESVESQIEAASASAARKGEDVFAVVVIGSRQYIVFPGRFLYTQRLKGANVNDKIILNKVLLVGTRTKAYIGQPVVTNAAVHAVVEELGLDKKVSVFKYKKKKNYRRNISHRQPNTRIRILGIIGYEEYPANTIPVEVPA